MEHKIGEVFDFEDKKIKAEINTNHNHYCCDGCMFDNSDECWKIKDYCGSGYRQDGNDVIFVEVK